MEGKEKFLQKRFIVHSNPFLTLRSPPGSPEKIHVTHRSPIRIPKATSVTGSRHLPKIGSKSSSNKQEKYGIEVSDDDDEVDGLIGATDENEEDEASVGPLPKKPGKGRDGKPEKKKDKEKDKEKKKKEKEKEKKEKKDKKDKKKEKHHAGAFSNASFEDVADDCAASAAPSVSGRIFGHQQQTTKLKL